MNEIAPRSDAGPPAEKGRPELAKALATAQQKCRAVAKDSENTFHKYHYASSEAIITEAKAALADCGLALLPVEQILNGFAKEGEGRYELVRKFVLLHCSGEWLPISSAWPVVPERGRPLDKATAIAATLSLAYLLRDLLLIPRIDPTDDLAAQNDTRPAKPAKPQPQRNGNHPPADGAELVQKLKAGQAKMVELGWCKDGELLAHIQKHGIKRKYPAELVRWAGDAIPWALEEAGRFKAVRKAAAEAAAEAAAPYDGKSITKKTLAGLKYHCEELGLDADDQAALLAKYDAAAGGNLTETQGAELLADLAARLRAKKEQERQVAEAEGIL